jgi:hypothetical protein
VTVSLNGNRGALIVELDRMLTALYAERAVFERKLARCWHHRGLGAERWSALATTTRRRMRARVEAGRDYLLDMLALVKSVGPWADVLRRREEARRRSAEAQAEQEFRRRGLPFVSREEALERMKQRYPELVAQQREEEGRDE